MKPLAVKLIGKNRAESTLASVALYCAGVRIVRSRPDLALLIDAKSAPARQRGLRRFPIVAIVPPTQKRGALAAGVDAAFARPLQWKAYSRLVERVLARWAKRIKQR